MPRCQAMVAERRYSMPGRCEVRRAVQVVRWAETPLRTKVLLLCGNHRAYVERHGKIETVAKGAR